MVIRQFRVPYAFADFELRHPLGGGGAGNVHIAVRDGDLCTLKRLDRIRNPTARQRERFERAVNRVAEIRHPNVVEILDHGIASYVGEQVMWLQMPYLPGAQPLSKVLESYPHGLPLDRVRHVLGECAGGLAELHRWSVVHRDLKPENILVLPDWSIVIIDVDLARLVDLQPLTEAGSRIGTTRYMAPEQLEGDAVALSDMWGLGVVAYECLTGRHPFDPSLTTRRGILERIIREDAPPPPQRVDGEVPAELQALLEDLLEKLSWRRADAGSIAEHYAAGGRPPAARTRPSASGWARERRPHIVALIDNQSARGLQAAAYGGFPPDGVVAPLSQATALSTGRELSRSYSSAFSVDLLTERLTHPNWWETRSLGRAHAPPAGELLDLKALQGGRQAAQMARAGLQVQDEEGVDDFRALAFPFVSFDDAAAIASMTVFDQMLNERGAFPDGNGRERAATAVLRLSLALLEDAANHTRLLSRIGCRSPDGTVLHLDGLGPRTGSKRAVCAIRVALLLQDWGQRCWIVCGGPLRWVFLAFGVAGLELMPGRHELLAPPRASTGRSDHFASPPARFDFPSLACTLPPDAAIAVLESELVPERHCFCSGCAGREPRERVLNATVHNLFTALRHADELAGIPPVERVRMLERQLERALHLHRRLRLHGIWPGDEQLLARLHRVVQEAKAYGLLEPRLRSSRSATG